MKPKNDWAKCIYILKNDYTTGTSMARILTDWDATFYKFQARLGEVERAHSELIITRKSIPYISKLTGKSKHYTQYGCASSKDYLNDLYDKINEHGLAGKD
tara:strand:- start:4536 stop:4838 length:303 start_codon:yes stop_codon:yes gene_type:complete